MNQESQYPNHPVGQHQDGMSGAATGGALATARRGFLGRGAAVAGVVAAAPVFGVRSAAASPSGTEADSGSAGGDLTRQPGYLGYRRADYAKPWGKFFTERTSPVQSHVPPALLAPLPSADIPSLAELREEMANSGYSPVETGWGTTADGMSWTAVLTDMPGGPEMWDWWFGWHCSHPSRYKLWHPEAHVYAGLAEDRTQVRGLTDKQRYIGNTSYVDEYLPDYRSGFEYYGSSLAGGILVQIGISFREPTDEGFDTPAFDGTMIVGRGGGQGQAATSSLFCHQVRATSRGSEMRSRFYNPADIRQDVRPADAAALAALAGRGPLPTLPAPELGSFLMLHSAQEMNRLAGFLPAPRVRSPLTRHQRPELLTDSKEHEHERYLTSWSGLHMGSHTPAGRAWWP